MARKICAQKWICAPASRGRGAASTSCIFELDHGVVTFDDQIALAEKLLQHPIAAQREPEESFRVILDEAQDTQHSRFFQLLEVTRPRKKLQEVPKTCVFRAIPQEPRGHFSWSAISGESIYWKRGA